MTYQRPDDVKGALRLHLNENTAGCSPAVIAALRTIDRDVIALYPDYAPIIAASERWFGVAPGWVQLVNGLDEGLHIVAQAARLRPASALRAPAMSRRSASREGGPGFGEAPEAVIVEPAFEMYVPCAEAAGLRVVRVAPQPDFAFPLTAVVAALTPATRLIYLTDPNNPTGLPIPAGAVEQIADAAPHALLLLDEAYADFSGRTLIGTPLDRHRNLIVGRTFAKAHGLAGLRIGALIAHPDTLAPIRRILPPFSINVCAAIALAAALDDRPYLEWCVTQSVESRQLIYDFCRRFSLKYWPSEANFVLVRVGVDAPAIVQEVAATGVLLRDRSNQPGCDGCIRITAGVADHTRTALTALEAALASRRR